MKIKMNIKIIQNFLKIKISAQIFLDGTYHTLLNNLIKN